MISGKSFEGKRVLVTGAASGFGAEAARQFADAGARVVLADLDESGAKAVAADLRGAIAIGVDVALPEQVEKMVLTSVEELGGLDVLVNNAGVPHRVQPMIDLAVETFDSQFAVNVRSVFLGAKYAVPHMAEGGVIINTASIAAKRPRPGLAVYNATKGAVLTLTRGLAVELAPRIRVCAVCPVGAQTGFVKSATGFDTLPDEALAAFVNGIPMGRQATSSDVAAAMLFLASDAASFLTGVCLDIDGGRSIQ